MRNAQGRGQNLEAADFRHVHFASCVGGNRGYSLLELIFTAALCVTAGAVAAPLLLTALDDVRMTGAVRYLSARLQQTRMEAVKRSADVGLQFVETAKGYAYAVYVDGNGNGVRTIDIQRGDDRRIGSIEHLADHFSGVDFGVLPGLPPVDAGGSIPGTDPIRLGPSRILTFTAAGTSSSGSLYLRGRRSLQYVIRVLGETGKTRVLKFDLRGHQWKPS
jgi:hypothetical protein